MTPDDIDNKSGDTPAEQLAAIFDEVKPLIKYRDEIYSGLCHELEHYGIADLKYSELSKSEKEICRKLLPALHRSRALAPDHRQEPPLPPSEK